MATDESSTNAATATAAATAAAPVSNADIAKLRESMADVLHGMSLLASKSDLTDLSHSVAVASSRLTSLEQQGATSTSTLPRLGGDGMFWPPPPPPPPPSPPPPPPQHHTSLSSDTNAGTGVPRFYKLEFPKYDGKEDPLNWFNHCEQFFRGQKTLDGDRVWLATYHLTGDAQEWYFHYEQHHGPRLVRFQGPVPCSVRATNSP